MTTNGRLGAENELQYLLKRCDEVFGSIDSLIKAGKYDVETLRALQAEGSELAQQLTAVVRRKRGTAPARGAQSFSQNIRVE